MKLLTHSLSSLAIAGLITSSHAALIGHWDFDEGDGTTAADSSASGNDGIITGASWGTDEVRASYLIFNGTDNVVDPAVTMPVMTLDNDFTWAVWANSQEAIGGSQLNSIIIGNRRDATDAEFIPRQFIKLTPQRFEWHQEGNGNDNLEAPNLILNTWHHLAVVKTGGTLEYFFDGVSVGTGDLIQTIGSAAHPFFIGGQAGATAVGEFFNGYIDDVRIYDEALDAAAVLALTDNYNFPPRFIDAPFTGADATINTAYSGTLADAAVDANAGDTLTFAKAVTDPTWLTVNSDGTYSGTPLLANVGINQFNIEVTDGNSTVTTSFAINVTDPGAPPAAPGVFGTWPLNDGTGAFALDTSGNNFTASITNPTTGGLGTDGSVWFDDPERGIVLSFNGVNSTGAFATVGAPPFGELPLLTLEQDFTWAFWAKSDQAANNDIIIGNRYSPSGTDFTPREFVKFTTRGFEYDATAAGHVTVDFEDLETGVWVHHAVVKTGTTLDYYRNGQLLPDLTQTISIAQTNPQPIYFGGFGSENWRGYLSDVNLFDKAASSAEVLFLYDGTPIGGFNLEFTDITVNSNGDTTLTWNSQSDASYSLNFSSDLVTWANYDDSIPSGGESTSLTILGNQFPLSTNRDRLFFQVTPAQ